MSGRLTFVQDGSQSVYVENPRKLPRVPVELTAELTYGTATWRALVLDFGPGGCLLYPGKPLGIGERLHAAFTNRDVVGRLSVDAKVAWTRGGRCGLSFAPASGPGSPREWFDQLLRKRPRLAAIVAGTPQRVALDACVSPLMPPLTSRPLPRDEASVLSAVGSAAPVRSIALHSRLPPQRFAHAFFALLEKRLVTTGAAAAPVSDAAPAARPSTARADHHQLAAEIALGVEHRGEAARAAARGGGVVKQLR